MKIILISILLIIFTVQPLLAQELTYRNTELNIMMSEKSAAEKEDTQLRTNHIIQTTIKSTLIGAGTGGMVIGLLVSSEYGAKGFPIGFVAGAILGSAAGLVVGVIVGSITDPKLI